MLSIRSPRRGCRPKSSHVSTLMNSEPRYICSSLIMDEQRGGGQCLFLILASSNASLTGHSFDWERQKWIEKADLMHDAGLVLSLDHIQIRLDQHRQEGAELQVILASGSTTGDVCLWDLTRTDCEGLSRATAADSTPTIDPVYVIEKLHQSGVNCLSVKYSPDRSEVISIQPPN